jgi:hypothetical protein
MGSIVIATRALAENVQGENQQREWELLFAPLPGTVGMGFFASLRMTIVERIVLKGVTQVAFTKRREAEFMQ